MNQDQFTAACAQAIEPYHDAAQDGPLLVATRMNTAVSVLSPSTRLIFPEYTAVIGEWPTPSAHPYGGLNDKGPVYHESVRDALTALVTEAKEKWSARLSAQGGDLNDDHDTEPADPFAGTAWASGR